MFQKDTALPFIQNKIKRMSDVSAADWWSQTLLKNRDFFMCGGNSYL